MSFQHLKQEVSRQLELKRKFRLLEINLFREELHRQFTEQVGTPVNGGGTKKC